MSKLKTETRGMIIIFIGFLFSILGMTILTEDEYGYLPLISSILGVLIIVFGLFKIFKANRVNGKNL
jgi:hypothetical protein